MDYKEKYEQALSRAKDNYKANQKIGKSEENEVLADIFPELEESEDERIHKLITQIINWYHVSHTYFTEIPKEKVMAWLKKQKPIELSQDDENIRKAVLNYFTKCWGNCKDNVCGIHVEDVIAWLEKKVSPQMVADAYLRGCNDTEKKLLEKQGEEPNPYSGTSFEYNGHTWGMCARDGGVEILMDSELKAFISSEKSFIFPIHPQPELAPKSDLEAINEEKVNNANKIEPKFHEGDWVVNNRTNKTYRINGVDVNNVNHITYSCVPSIYTDEDLPCFREDMIHLWDIAKDAKDGDVLATKDWVFIFKQMNSSGKPVCYCHYDIELGFHIDTNSYIATGSEIYPATKEQRGLLFQKMHEAGYEWDADKKQLGRIIDEKQIKKNLQDNSFRRMFEQKSDWNEHDEYILKGIIDEIEANKNSGPVYDIETYDRFLNWLKSLRPMWKPSDEQMEVLKVLVDDNDQRYFYPTLKSLYNDLEKLKRINHDTERSN